LRQPASRNHNKPIVVIAGGQKICAPAIRTVGCLLASPHRRPSPRFVPRSSRPLRKFLLRVNRVDIAKSALASAIHNTGHYHVRPRPGVLIVFLRSICKRRARPPQLLRPASVDLVNMLLCRLRQSNDAKDREGRALPVLHLLDQSSAGRDRLQGPDRSHGETRQRRC
jgi:hypothetical protein